MNTIYSQIKIIGILTQEQSISKLESHSQVALNPHASFHGKQNSYKLPSPLKINPRWMDREENEKNIMPHSINYWVLSNCRISYVALTRIVELQVPAAKSKVIILNRQNNSNFEPNPDNLQYMGILTGIKYYKPSDDADWV